MNSDAITDLKQREIFLREINNILAEQHKGCSQSKSDLPRTSVRRYKVKKQRLQKHRKTRPVTIQTLIMIAIATSVSFTANQWNDEIFPSTETNQMSSKYVIENLRGDTVSTAKTWHWVKGTDMFVGINNEANVSQDKLDAIKNAILSEDTMYLDGRLTHTKYQKEPNQNTMLDGKVF